MAERRKLARLGTAAFPRLCIMAHVVTPLDQPSNYKDSQNRVDKHAQNEVLSKSSTLYVCYCKPLTIERCIYILLRLAISAFTPPRSKSMNYFLNVQVLRRVEA